MTDWGPWRSLLCITLPKASRTACDVKFSEGMRLMKCFCRLFSCGLSVNSSLHVALLKARINQTFWMMSNITGSASSRLAASSCGKVSYDWETYKPTTDLVLTLRTHWGHTSRCPPSPLLGGPAVERFERSETVGARRSTGILCAQSGSHIEDDATFCSVIRSSLVISSTISWKNNGPFGDIISAPLVVNAYRSVLRGHLMSLTPCIYLTFSLYTN